MSEHANRLREVSKERFEKIKSLESQLAEKDREVHRLRLGGFSPLDYQRLVEWMKDPNRKPATTAFTAGMARDAARAFEDSGIEKRGGMG